MARVYRWVSDLTGRDITGEGERAEVRVLDHPLISHPVQLDALATEVAPLRDADLEPVTVELVLPGASPVRRIVERGRFDALFGDGVAVAEALAGAEPYGPAPTTRRRRRGAEPPAQAARPRAAASAADRERLQAMREWARANGWPDLGNRGRVPHEVQEAYAAAHPE